MKEKNLVSQDHWTQLRQHVHLGTSSQGYTHSPGRPRHGAGRGESDNTVHLLRVLARRHTLAYVGNQRKELFDRSPASHKAVQYR